MSAPLGKYSVEEFLASYWQKRPCIIRGAFENFQPDIDGNDLAGLACEEMAESRLICGSFKANDWDVRHGPFDEDDFAGLGNENWTLLVQDVEKHYAPLQDLMQQFRFIPDWRLDDLMISYAATGGSVGPHIDQYDVFLLQAEGRRRWQIAQSFNPELLENCPLNVLRSFESEQEWVLEPGDMLYLPPNVAHHGVALEPGMTWSIGSRAPSAADLLQGYGEWLAFSEDQGGRYADPDLQIVSRSGEIDRQALQSLKQFMRSGVEDEQGLDSFLAAFLSRFRLANEPAPPPDTITQTELLRALESGSMLQRNPWTRLAWVQSPAGATLFAAGQSFHCSIQLAEQLCHSVRLSIKPSQLDTQEHNVLLGLVNKGHFNLDNQ